MRSILSCKTYDKPLGSLLFNNGYIKLIICNIPTLQRLKSRSLFKVRLCVSLSPVADSLTGDRKKAGTFSPDSVR